MLRCHTLKLRESAKLTRLPSLVLLAFYPQALGSKGLFLGGGLGGRPEEVGRKFRS